MLVLGVLQFLNNACTRHVRKRRQRLVTMATSPGFEDSRASSWLSSSTSYPSTVSLSEDEDGDDNTDNSEAGGKVISLLDRLRAPTQAEIW